MLKREDLPACPVETTLMLVGSKWKLSLCEILQASVRKSLPIA